MSRIPRINLDDLATPHAKWLENKAIEHEAAIETLRSLLNRVVSGQNTAVSVQLASLADESRTNRTRINSTTGIPPGGTPPQIMEKVSDADGDAEWVYHALGGMRAEFFDLDSTNNVVDLLSTYEAKMFEVNITSSVDNEAYDLVLPDLYDATADLQMPFYILSIYVNGASADVTMAGVVPTYYDHPSVSIVGVEPSPGGSGYVTLPDGFVAQWFVLGNFSSGNSVAIPMVDDYYSDRFGSGVVAGSPPSVAVAAEAGTGAAVTVLGTSVAGTVQLDTGTSPTTTGWAELLTFTDTYWDAGTVPVLQLTPADQNAAALTHYEVRSGAEAQSHFDLTGIVASTTYTFHYSLLPFAQL